MTMYKLSWNLYTSYISIRNDNDYFDIFKSYFPPSNLLSNPPITDIQNIVDFIIWSNI